MLKVEDRKTGKICYFIPEICQLTGMSDAQRANFNLMRDMSRVLHKQADVRIQEAKKLTGEMTSNERVKKHLSQWDVKIE